MLRCFLGVNILLEAHLCDFHQGYGYAHGYGSVDEAETGAISKAIHIHILSGVRSIELRFGIGRISCCFFFFPLPFDILLVVVLVLQFNSCFALLLYSLFSIRLYSFVFRLHLLIIAFS